MAQEVPIVSELAPGSTLFELAMEKWPSHTSLDTHQYSVKMRDSPYGSASLFAATVGSELAAALIYGHLKTGVGDTQLNSGFVYHTTTEPEWRGRGLMTEVITKSNELMKEKGVDLLFALPNPMALGAYLRSGYSHVGKLRGWVRIRPANISGVVAQFKARGELQSRSTGKPVSIPNPLATDPPEEARSASYSFRDREFLDWRLNSYSQSQYEILTGGSQCNVIRSGSRGGIPERQILSIRGSDTCSTKSAIRAALADFDGIVSTIISDGPWVREYLKSGFIPTRRGAPILTLGLSEIGRRAARSRIYLDGLDVHTW